jgi:ketosteroid isomerase-like protein
MMEGKYIIRPSGNPLTAEQQKAMMSTEGMEMGTQELVAINSMDISGDMAQVTYTAHQVFTFKGTPNDDVAVMLIVFKKDESGSWKILTGMRSQGRPPSDPKPEFPN